MTRPDSFRFGFFAALGAAALSFILYTGWWLLSAVLAIATPFVGAIVLSLLLDPLVTLLQRRVTAGSRFRAVAIVFLFIVLLIAGVFTFVVPNLISQTQALVRWFAPVTYTVRRSSGAEDSDSASRFVTVAEGIVPTSYTARGLVNGTTYHFVVSAIGSEGAETAAEEVTIIPSSRRPKDDTSASGSPPASDSTGQDTPARKNADPSAKSPPKPSGQSTTTEGPTVITITTGGTPADSPAAETAPPPANPAAAEAPQKIIVTPGDGTARLTWQAPASGKSGFDDVREKIDAWLKQHRQIGPVKLPKNLESVTTQYSDQLAQGLKVSAGKFASIVIGSVSSLFEIILVPIIAAYILGDIDRLRARMVFLLPANYRDVVQKMAKDVGEVFGGYIRGLILVCACYAGASTVAMLALSIFFPAMRAYALLLGLAAGLLYAVPYIGAIATAILAGVVALTTGSGLGALVWSAVLLLLVNQIFDNIVYPRVVGGGVGLPPVLALFALLLGAHLFGLWGMLLSVPVAASIQVVLFRLFPHLASPTPLAMMMPARPLGPEPPPSSDTASPVGSAETKPDTEA